MINHDNTNNNNSNNNLMAGTIRHITARGHTADTDTTPTSWPAVVSSNHVGHIPSPAIPSYYKKTPHCTAPRRWRMHTSVCCVLMEISISPVHSGLRSVHATLLRKTGLQEREREVQEKEGEKRERERESESESERSSTANEDNVSQEVAAVAPQEPGKSTGNFDFQ